MTFFQFQQCTHRKSRLCPVKNQNRGFHERKVLLSQAAESGFLMIHTLDDPNWIVTVKITSHHSCRTAASHETHRNRQSMPCPRPCRSPHIYELRKNIGAWTFVRFCDVIDCKLQLIKKNITHLEPFWGLSCSSNGSKKKRSTIRSTASSHCSKLLQSPKSFSKTLGTHEDLDLDSLMLERMSMFNPNAKQMVNSFH